MDGGRDDSKVIVLDAGRRSSEADSVAVADAKLLRRRFAPGGGPEELEAMADVLSDFASQRAMRPLHLVRMAAALRLMAQEARANGQST